MKKATAINIEKFLPAKKNFKLLHVHVEESAYDKVRSRLKEENISWQDFINACFKAYLESKNS